MPSIPSAAQWPICLNTSPNLCSFSLRNAFLIMALASVRIWEQAVCDRHIGSLIQKSAMVSIGVTCMLAVYLTQYRWSADREYAAV